MITKVVLFMLRVFFLPTLLGEWIKEKYGLVTAKIVTVIIIVIAVASVAFDNLLITTVIGIFLFLYTLGVWPPDTQEE